MSELMTCKSSQPSSALMLKLLSVFTKNILYPTQSRPKVPFREAEIQVKQFAKDIVTATPMLTEQTYQALEEMYGQPMSRTVVMAILLSKQLIQQRFEERQRLM